MESGCNSDSWHNWASTSNHTEMDGGSSSLTLIHGWILFEPVMMSYECIEALVKLWWRCIVDQDIFYVWGCAAIETFGIIRPSTQTTVSRIMGALHWPSFMDGFYSNLPLGCMSVWNHNTYCDEGVLSINTCSLYNNGRQYCRFCINRPSTQTIVRLIVWALPYNSSSDRSYSKLP